MDFPLHVFPDWRNISAGFPVFFGRIQVKPIIGDPEFPPIRQSLLDTSILDNHHPTDSEGHLLKISKNNHNHRSKENQFRKRDVVFQANRLCLSIASFFGHRDFTTDFTRKRWCSAEILLIWLNQSGFDVIKGFACCSDCFCWENISLETSPPHGVDWTQCFFWSCWSQMTL